MPTNKEKYRDLPYMDLVRKYEAENMKRTSKVKFLKWLDMKAVEPKKPQVKCDCKVGDIFYNGEYDGEANAVFVLCAMNRDKTRVFIAPLNALLQLDDSDVEDEYFCDLIEAVYDIAGEKARWIDVEEFNDICWGGENSDYGNLNQMGIFKGFFDRA